MKRWSGVSEEGRLGAVKVEQANKDFARCGCRGGAGFRRDDLAGSDQTSDHTSCGTDLLDGEGGGHICGCGTEVRALDREEVEVGAGRATGWGQRVEGGSDGLRQCKSAKADESA